MIASAPSSARTGLRIVPIRVKDLYRFSCEYLDNASGQRISPITRHRALAQSKNPYADPDDVGLLIAYDGDQCIGYQGILPGLVRTRSASGKVLWFTANYVLPEFRKRMVGILFLKHVMSMGCDVVATGFEHAGAHMLKGLHFRELGPLTYGKLNLERLDFVGRLLSRGHRLQRRWPLLRSISGRATGVSRALLYRPARSLYFRRLARHVHRRLQGVRVREARNVRASAQSDENPAPRFERGVELINWTIEFPWVTENQAPTVPEYFFSDTRGLARRIVLELESAGGQDLGFAVLFISELGGRRYVKITDHRCAPQNREAILCACLKYALEYRASEIQWPLSFEDVAARLPLANCLLECVQRPYMYFPSAQSPIAEVAQEMVLDLSDGDCSFA
jgi:hypothetical protein